MRTTTLDLVFRLGRSADVPEPVFEFGAYRVAGQERRGDVRDAFPGKRFVGCDVRIGPGVDQVHDLHALALPDDGIGTAVLLDTVEHVREPWRALAEVHRCLKRGGLLLMTSVMYFPFHAYPDDYWRFTEAGFATLLREFTPIAIASCGIRTLPHTVVGIASKGAIDPVVAQSIRDAVDVWKRCGATSWKEWIMAVAPPCVLSPGYALYVRALEALRRRGPL